MKGLTHIRQHFSKPLLFLFFFLSLLYLYILQEKKHNPVRNSVFVLLIFFTTHFLKFKRRITPSGPDIVCVSKKGEIIRYATVRSYCSNSFLLFLTYIFFTFFFLFLSIGDDDDDKKREERKAARVVKHKKKRVSTLLWRRNI